MFGNDKKADVFVDEIRIFVILALPEIRGPGSPEEKASRSVNLFHLLIPSIAADRS